MLIFRFVFFYSSVSTPFPQLLLYSTCLTSLHNMFRAIQQELFFMLILKEFTKFKKEKPWWSFFLVRSLARIIQVYWSWTLGWVFDDDYRQVHAHKHLQQPVALYKVITSFHQRPIKQALHHTNIWLVSCYYKYVILNTSFVVRPQSSLRV